MNDNKEVGFSQRIQLEWLERTAELALAGKSKEEILNELQELLRNRLSVGGKSLRGNREKAITILLRTWVHVPKKLEPFRNDGLAILQNLPAQDHLPLHWGMVIAVYPFFRLVAETVGRLIQLQNNFNVAQILRRLFEQYGERETVKRAAQRILRCFVDWGVLLDSEEKGGYQAISKGSPKNQRLTLWLIEALLISTNADSIPLADALRSPSFFPFVLKAINIQASKQNHRIQTFRQALDEEVVMLVDRR